jgi:hypothetical protein
VSIEQTILTAFQQAPGIVALVIVVRIFMGYMRSRDEKVARLGDECHRVQQRAITALDRNSNALTRVERVLDEIDPRSIRPGG